MSRLDLNQITLFCFESREPALAKWAIQRCLAQATFKKVVLVTNLSLVKNPLPEIEYVFAPSIRSVKDYSYWMMTELAKYVSGSHVLVIQWDSFITNASLWNSDFLKYDYIGPVWPHHPDTPVGNGGFSLRSLKILQALQDPEVRVGHPEDYFICAENREFLERKYGIQFAPIEVAEQFAVERTAWHPAFGFHGLFNFGRVLSPTELYEVLIKIPSAFLRGVDAYDLANSLSVKDQRPVFNILAQKIPFSWKMRYRYLALKFRYLFN
jgi:hypothetical protein